ncbi:MAG: phosphatase PAP2 family protein [Candidatus Aenigmarchaeota archaeon]|nr:phosphatase PAP2 family protein [Candidatus Aenigmarchaeota archaeon]
MNLKKFYLNSFMQDITAFGTVYHLAVLIAVLVAFNQNPLAYKLAAGQIIMYFISVPIKIVLFKNRPEKMRHKNIIEKIEASSFPSVHTMRIFFISSVLIPVFNNIATSVILAILSLAVAYSRIYLKRHYYADVIAGAAIGIIIGYGVSNYV